MLRYRKSIIVRYTLILNGSIRMITDYDFPLTLGNELSGVIEACGKDFVNFQVGNRVYTRLPVNKIGVFAEYVAVKDEAIFKMPKYRINSNLYLEYKLTELEQHKKSVGNYLIDIVFLIEEFF